MYRIDYLYRRFVYCYRRASHPQPIASSLKNISNRYIFDFLIPLSEQWQHNIENNLNIMDEFAQSLFFKKKVHPLLTEGKTVFVLVCDSIRWEAGMELFERLKEAGKYNIQIEAMRAMIPTYTAHGSAALLPHNQLELELNTAQVKVDGSYISGIEGKQKYLSNYVEKKYNEIKAHALTLESFLTPKQENVEQHIKSDRLIYLYSSSIDTAGHNSDYELPDAIEKEIYYIKQAINKIYSKSKNAIVFIVSDHGFLFYLSLNIQEYMISVPELKGETYREQRFILGNNLEPLQGFFQIKVPGFALKGEATALVAKELMKISCKGANGNYTHGGMTLQEVVVPCIQINFSKKEEAQKAPISILGSTNITTPTIVQTVYQEKPVGGTILPHRVRLWFESNDGKVLSNKKECYCDSMDTEDVNRSYKVTFEFLPEAKNFKNQNINLKIVTIAEGGTETASKVQQFYLKQIAYDIDQF